MIIKLVNFYMEKCCREYLKELDGLRYGEKKWAVKLLIFFTLLSSLDSNKKKTSTMKSYLLFASTENIFQQTVGSDEKVIKKQHLITCDDSCFPSTMFGIYRISWWGEEEKKVKKKETIFHSCDNNQIWIENNWKRFSLSRRSEDNAN